MIRLLFVKNNLIRRKFARNLWKINDRQCFSRNLSKRSTKLFREIGRAVL